MEEVVIAYISRELISRPELLPLKDNTSLIESDILDSLSLLKLLLFLEEEFHIQIDDFEVVPENFNTVSAICQYIRAHEKGKVA